MPSERPCAGRSPLWSEIVGGAQPDAIDPTRRHARSIGVLSDAVGDSAESGNPVHTYAKRAEKGVSNTNGI